MLSWLRKRQLKHGQPGKVVERILALDANSALEDQQFCLPEHEMVQLCKASRKVLLDEDALLDLPEVPEQTVIVGDLHGQLADLQTIFSSVGRPGSSKKFIFLGDYVDRGECGLEIVACLLCLKLLHPACVFLLRGNHECSQISAMFGFFMECQRRSTLAVWDAVMETFDALPLAALVGRHILCVHGGISQHLTRLSDINAIQRPTDVDPSCQGLLQDLLWADPSGSSQGWGPSPRGVSFTFGLDVAREAMRRLGLRSIVRAHSMQEGGYEVLGDDEVVTVFSAVNYRGTGNSGAVLLLDSNLVMRFRTFHPPPTATSSSSSAAAAAAAAAAAGEGSPPPLPMNGTPLGGQAQQGQQGGGAAGGGAP